MSDIRQSKNYAKYMESLGWIVDKRVFIKKLWFTSVVKVQHFSKKVDLSFLKKYHPFLIKLEPSHQNLVPPGFRRDDWPLLPTKTLVLDLKKINLPKDTKYEIRKAEKNGLFIKKNSSSKRTVLSKEESLFDVETFYKMLQETMKIGHWWVPIRKEVTSLWQAFQPSNSTILMTAHSGCLLIWYGDTAHYMYAANTVRGRELGAAYLTLWEAIKFCQKKKLKYLDLEGIYDERYPKQTKNWKGFTKFKLGWGGKVVEYPGSFTKYDLPIYHF